MVESVHNKGLFLKACAFIGRGFRSSIPGRHIMGSHMFMEQHRRFPVDAAIKQPMDDGKNGAVNLMGADRQR